MKRTLALLILTLFITTAFAQSKKTIIEKGITKISTFEQKLENGIDNKFLTKEEFYDAHGRLVELKEYSRKGTITLWEKYTYNEKGKIVEELRLNKLGKVKKRLVSKYENGLLISREYYDSENRLYRIKTIEYSYGQ